MPSLRPPNQDNMIVVSAPFAHGQRKDGVQQSPSLLIPTLSTMTELLDSRLHMHRIVAEAGPSGLHQPGAVAASCEGVYRACREAASRGESVLTIGGDHSIAMGSVAGVAMGLRDRCRFEDLAVVWVDAHADINTVKSTKSGNLHGCPVSFLLGHGDSIGQLPGMAWLEEEAMAAGKPILQPRNLVYIGLRDVEEQEEEILQEYGIRSYRMAEVKQLGIDRIMAEIRTSFASLPIHLSFDVDGIDPAFTPSTGTAVPGGLSLEEGVTIVRSLKDRLVSMDLVEVNLSLGTMEERERTLDSSLQLLRALEKN